MDQALSILLFVFSAALLLYAGLLAMTRDYNLLPRRGTVSVKPKDPKAYTAQLAKAIALTAAAPALGGLVALWNQGAGMLVMFAAFAVFLWLTTKITKNANEPRKESASIHSRPD